MKYLDLLPDDIIDYIYTLIYFTQPSFLISDIKNYINIKKQIINKYYEYYEYTNNINNEFFIYYAIENDILSYLNDNIPYNDGITENNLYKLERLLSYSIKKNINFEKTNYNFHINNKISAISRINRCLSVLTIDERNDFINNYI